MPGAAQDAVMPQRGRRPLDLIHAHIVQGNTAVVVHDEIMALLCDYIPWHDEAFDIIRCRKERIELLELPVRFPYVLSGVVRLRVLWHEALHRGLHRLRAA